MESAVRFLLVQSEFGELAPEEVRGPGGEVVMTRAQILSINWEMEDGQEALVEAVKAARMGGTMPDYNPRGDSVPMFISPGGKLTNPYGDHP